MTDKLFKYFIIYQIRNFNLFRQKTIYLLSGEINLRTRILINLTYVVEDDI